MKGRIHKRLGALTTSSVGVGFDAMAEMHGWRDFLGQALAIVAGLKAGDAGLKASTT
jgi:hypothetical protein